MIDKESETIAKDIKSKADIDYLKFMNGEMSFEEALAAQNKAIEALNKRIVELEKGKKNA